MLGLIRRLLICCLVLAIPAQGAAVAAMAFCGPLHHGKGARAATPLAALPSHSHHDGDAGHGHAPAHAHAPDPSAGDQGKAEPPTGSSDDPHQCTVCGACCSAGAPMGSVPALPVTVAAATAFATLVATVDPFAADGPDRPPRSPRV